MSIVRVDDGEVVLERVVEPVSEALVAVVETELCECGTMAPIADRIIRNAILAKHSAPCGAVCIWGSGMINDKLCHIQPWDGPPETDSHYHGECPNGCFDKCCDPPGNLCGPNCQTCFGDKT